MSLEGFEQGSEGFEQGFEGFMAAWPPPPRHTDLTVCAFSQLAGTLSYFLIWEQDLNIKLN